MIELPEALTIARQIHAELRGKKITSAIRGNSPHKWAFYSGSPEEYATILGDKTMGGATERGSLILASVEPDYVLILGGGGERILFHRGEETLPKKHHLLLRYQDGTYLTVTVQGWGSVQLLKASEVSDHPDASKMEVSPLSDAFTFEHFQQLFNDPEVKPSTSAKAFVISKPGVPGVGNGYLQDILFRAKIHPRRRVVEMSEADRWSLYGAIRETLEQAVEMGGRDTERDLYNSPGEYQSTLDRRAKDKPCPQCGTPIAKIQYLGGAAYFCPSCQT